jgi:anti-sigma-K factor RskA
MYDEEQDTLAAEYVLGTLSAEEREHAEALLSFDPGFESAVRQWERRLGELNVMVEAIEPPPEVWEKIKSDVTATAAAPAGEPTLPSPRDLDEPAIVAALAADLGTFEAVAASPPSAETAPEIPASALIAPAPAPAATEPKTIERSADVIYLAGRVRRWRSMTIAFGAIAALLAIYVAVWQAAPELIPPGMRPAASGTTAKSDVSARLQQDRLVAVLQQGPNAPAFLVTLDTSQRTLFVRRVSATPEAGKSYELWLIANRASTPRSLGVVSNDEFTEHPLPANLDVATLRGATYAVSLEPAGGSKSGAPTGPVLYTGKAVEALPASPPPKPAMPKT